MSEHYLVDLTYRTDTTLQDRHRPDHLRYLQTRIDAGQLLASGPKGADETPGGVLLYRTHDRAEVESVVDNDPFTINGVVVRRTISSWVPMSGPHAAALHG